MLQNVQTQRFVRSRIGQPVGAEIRPLRKRIQAPYRYGYWIGLSTLVYFALGYGVQRVDPTAGWLDIGMLSLPLFAAWSCLLGYGVAGLLPVLLQRIGKKGGINKWISQESAILLAYLCYVVLLCVLL